MRTGGGSPGRSSLGRMGRSRRGRIFAGGRKCAPWGGKKRSSRIAAGTYFGGWKIVHTMGSKITKLKPVGGFCAEAAGAITLFGTALAGIPVSTTHTITGAIVGVGTTNRLSAVRWGVAGRIVWAW